MPNYRYHSQEYGCCQNGYRQQHQHQHQVCPVCLDNQAEEDEVNGMTIAMAYVPWQEWRDLYTCEQALQRGTVFAELDKPFKGMGGCCR